jgi:molecular chaperone GrpE
MHPSPKEPQKEEDYKQKYLQLLADAENLRKRVHKEQQQTTRFVIENTIIEFLPALDNLENALQFSKQSSEEIQNWMQGFWMILSQFKEVLHKHGITTFHAVGSHYDPHLHEAVEIEETHEHPDGMILEEYVKGYKSPYRTLRPAHVKVAKKPQESTSQESLQQGENDEHQKK